MRKKIGMICIIEIALKNIFIKLSAIVTSTCKLLLGIRKLD